MSRTVWAHKGWTNPEWFKQNDARNAKALRLHTVDEMLVPDVSSSVAVGFFVLAVLSACFEHAPLITAFVRGVLR